MRTVEQIIDQMHHDSKLKELYSIAEQLELSLVEKLEVIDGVEFTSVTAFFAYPEDTVIMAVTTNTDRTQTVMDAIDKTLQQLDA